MSGRAPASLEPTAPEGSLSEEEVETIREAEQEHRLKPTDATPPTELSLDKKFELLKNQRRRRVLRYLMQNGEASTTGELAEHIAVLENDKNNTNELTSKERKAAYVGLYQCHLPKMDDYGVIQFNQARGDVRLTELAYNLEEYLTQEKQPSWSVRYLTASLVGGTVVVGSFLVGSSLLTAAGTLGTLFVVIAIAAWHRWSERAD